MTKTTTATNDDDDNDDEDDNDDGGCGGRDGHHRMRKGRGHNDTTTSRCEGGGRGWIREAAPRRKVARIRVGATRGNMNKRQTGGEAPVD